ncbi:MAG: hypothetical protein KA765_04270 [Thermoflexales bacterium]|nr:hypothetical protein [Thermoflexales bacterium]
MKIKATFKQLSRRLLKFIKRELPAIFVCMSILAGALLMAVVARELTGVRTTAWFLLAVSVAFLRLPKAFNKDRNSKEPYLIRFAYGFREGFVPMSSAVQNLQVLFDKIQALKQKMSDSK